MTEQQKAVETWIIDLKTRVQALTRLAVQTGKKTVFTISSTSKSDPLDQPYLTPLRETPSLLVSGTVVRSMDQGIMAAQLVNGIIASVYVDSEGKKGLKTDHDVDQIKALGLKTEARNHWEGISLPEACFPYLDKSESRIFKPNDITVDSVWYYLMEKRVTRGLAVILGAGNIGFKLALKLVETGFEVALFRRDKEKLHTMVEAIEQIKPPHSQGRAFAVELSDNLLAKTSVLIGSSDGQPVVLGAAVNSVPRQCLLVDVGKGTFSEEAIKAAHQNEMEIYRADITSGLDAFLTGMERCHHLLSKELGRREIAPGTWVVSGGYLGRCGDVIVDSYREPGLIIGVADGCGDIIRVHDAEAETRINAVRAFILQNMQERIKI